MASMVPIMFHGSARSYPTELRHVDGNLSFGSVVLIVTAGAPVLPLQLVGVASPAACIAGAVEKFVQARLANPFTPELPHRLLSHTYAGFPTNTPVPARSNLFGNSGVNGFAN